MKRSIALLVLAFIGCGDLPSDSQSQAFSETESSYDDWQYAVYKSYYSDVPGYWAKGLATLARLVDINAGSEIDARMTFSGLAPAFDEARFFSAYKTGGFTPRFQKYLASSLYYKAQPWDAFISAVRSTTRDLDAARRKSGEESLYALDALKSLRVAFEGAINQKAITVAPVIGPDASAAGLKGDVECAAGPAVGQEVLTIKWRDVSQPTDHWPGTTGSCKAAAAGLCAAKLGLAGFSDTVTCAQWNELSGDLNGKTISDYMEGKHGLKCENVRACSVAAAALDRGCDVFMYFYQPSSHVEMVTWISPTSHNSCRAHTRSWGNDASADYEDGTNPYNGKYTGKSNANDFAPPFNGGGASFTVCC